LCELKEDYLRQYKTLFDGMAQGVFTQLADGTLVDVNPAALDMFGVDRDQFFGRTSFSPGWKVVNEEGTDLLPEQHPSMVALRTGLPLRDTVVGVYNPEKESFSWLIANAIPVIREGEETPYQVFVTLQDISERKAMEENYRRLASLTSDYVHCCTRTGKSEFQVQWVDGAVNSISGYRIEDVLTLGCFLPLVHPDDRQTVSDYLLSLVSGDRKTIEFRIVTQLGEIRWVSEKSHCEAGQSEDELILLGAVTDITKRKKAETRIRESNEELDAFVQTVAHDLRTPITPIIGYAEILRENYKEQLDEQGLSYLTVIEKAGEEMLALMENLLSLAQSGSLKWPIEHVSADEVVAGVIKNLEADICSAGVALQTTSLPSVRVPKTFLIQIFDNLIGNAVRYAGKDSDLIEVGGEQRGNQIRFFVRDHGPGISEQDRKHVFEIFYRGTNKRQVKGSGIGLAIVYKIARNCGGRAWVEETDGGGCTFWVELEDVDQA